MKDAIRRISRSLRKRSVRYPLDHKIRYGNQINWVGFRSHFEKLFEQGMTWQNYGGVYGENGYGKWNIDHIIPREFLRTICVEPSVYIVYMNHYLNLQPMWYNENCKKKNTLPDSKTFTSLATKMIVRVAAPYEIITENEYQDIGP